MHTNLWQWISLIGMAAFAILFAVEINRWRWMGDVVSRKQRVLRALLVLLVEVLLLMVFFGPVVTAHGSRLRELVYWDCCVLVGLAVVVLAVLDVRELDREISGSAQADVHRHDEKRQNN